MLYKSKKEAIEKLTQGMKEIVDTLDVNDPSGSLNKITKKMEQFMEENKPNIAFWDISPEDLVKPTLKKLISEKSESSWGIDPDTKRHITDDLVVIDTKGLSVPNAYESRSKFIRPMSFMSFCVGGLIPIFQKAFSSAGDTVTHCTSEEQRIRIITNAFHQMIFVKADDSQVNMRILQLIMTNDPDKASSEISQYISKENFNQENTDAVVQIFPVHELKKIALVAKSDKFFMALMLPYDDKFQVDRKDFDMDEIFISEEGFKEFLNSTCKKGELRKRTPEASESKFFIFRKPSNN